uniref:Arrestin-like N-terminal domain-containing protein n=1 Tax=Acrobeloides nanus TaxID=290746 RepID=A0A914E882_9BILA
MYRSLPSTNGISSSSYEIEVILEKAIYNPGDLLTGEVRLTLYRKLCCELITVQLYGSTRVFFTEKVTKPGALSQTKAYEQENVLINLKSDIWKCPEKEEPKREVSLNDIARMASSTAIRMPTSKSEKQPGIGAGVHSLPFVFQLPESGLHTSFDARNAAGYIRYYILIQALSNGYTVARKKLLFPIVCHQLLNQDQRSFESPILKGSKKVGKYNFH